MVKVVDNEKTVIGKLGSKVRTALRYKPITETSEAPMHWSPKNRLLNHRSSNNLSKSTFGRRTFHGRPIFATFILELPKKQSLAHVVHVCMSRWAKTYWTSINIGPGSTEQSYRNLQTHVLRFFTQNIIMFDWLETQTYKAEQVQIFT